MRFSARKFFIVDAVGSLAQARSAILSAAYAAVLLDLQLSDGDGLTLLPELRALPDRPLVIVLTARDQVSNRSQGLDAGADSNMLEVFISRLRRKLSREHIQTMRGLGYRLAHAEPPAPPDMKPPARPAT